MTQSLNRPGRGVALALSLWILAAIATGCATGTAPAGKPSDAPQATKAPATPAAAGDDRVLGSPQAPVTIIEFTDLQCPFCARFALETWPLLRQHYVDSGKVRFASRDLPLSFHDYALPAAVAARCAGQQGKFWEYREALFRGQSRLANAPYDELAGRFGLDVAKFAACRAAEATVESVRADAAVAAANGIASTPTFVIGRVVNGEFAGEIVAGAQPFNVFAQKIDSLLQQAQQ
jgi:protein-disulfide isomerase